MNSKKGLEYELAEYFIKKFDKIDLSPFDEQDIKKKYGRKSKKYLFEWIFREIKKEAEWIGPLYIDKAWHYFLEKPLRRNTNENVRSPIKKDFFLFNSYSIANNLLLDDLNIDKQKIELAPLSENSHREIQSWKKISKRTSKSYDSYIMFGYMHHAIRNSLKEIGKRNMNEYVSIISSTLKDSPVLTRKLIDRDIDDVLSKKEVFDELNRENKQYKKKLKKTNISDELVQNHAKTSSIARHYVSLLAEYFKTLKDCFDDKKEIETKHSQNNLLELKSNFLIEEFPKDIVDKLNQLKNVEFIEKSTMKAKNLNSPIKKFYTDGDESLKILNEEELTFIKNLAKNLNIKTSENMVLKYPYLTAHITDLLKNRGFDYLDYDFDLLTNLAREFEVMFRTDIKVDAQSHSLIKSFFKGIKNNLTFENVIITRPKNSIEAILSETKDCLSLNGRFEQEGINIIKNKYSHIINVEGIKYKLVRTSDESYKLTSEVEDKYTLGRLFLYEAIMNNSKILYVDGFSGSEFLRFYPNWNSKLYDYVINLSSQMKDIQGILFNLNHKGRASKSYFTYEFDKVVADRLNLKEGKDYSFDWENKKKDSTPIFNLLDKEIHKINILKSKNVSGGFFLEGVLKNPNDEFSQEPIIIQDIGYVMGKYVDKNKILK